MVCESITMKLLVYLVVISGLLYLCDCDDDDDDSVYHDQLCYRTGCRIYVRIENGTWIDEETDKEWEPARCLHYNATVKAHCKANQTYFGRTKITATCTLGDHLEYTGFCSDKDYRYYTENKDCIVPLYEQNIKKWTLAESTEEILPGAYVREYQSIRVICHKGYNLPYGKTGIGKCQSGKWTFDANVCLGHPSGFCSSSIGCTLPSLRNGDWIDKVSGLPLSNERCIGKNTYVTAVCHDNFSYFDRRVFTEECDNDSHWIRSGYCTARSYGCFKKDKDCIVPDPIEHGQWLMEDTEETILPGTYVRSNTIIRIICSSKYSLFYDGTHHITRCNSGQWTYYNSQCVDADRYCPEQPLSSDCKLPKHPANGKWIDGRTGKELRAGICVQPGTTVNAVCNRYSSFFGRSNWEASCTISDDLDARWDYEGFCSYDYFDDFEPNEDCVVPETFNNTKWILSWTESEISPGTYVKETTKIRAICKSNLELLYGSGDVTSCESGRWTPHKPICVDRSGEEPCEDWVHCVLQQHPENGKWIDGESGEELKPGTCVKSLTSVTGLCDHNFNYFGYKSFTAECDSLFPKPIYSCTDQNPEGYFPYKDCIVPKNPGNSTWTSLETNEQIFPGTYVKGNVKIRSLCMQNFTRTSAGVALCYNGKWKELPERCGDIYIDKRSTNSTWDYCSTPDLPENGQWVTWDSRTLLITGNYIKKLTQISVDCNKNHKDFSTVTVSKCEFGKWENIFHFGLCEVVCDPLYSAVQYRVYCITNNKRTENCTEPLEGAIAEITCKPIYQNLHVWESRSKFRVCLRGRWSNNVFPNCIPKTTCGLESPNFQPLIVDGTIVPERGFPWHVALYVKHKERRKIICGGSLIRDNMVITAAHCISTTSGKLLNESMYEVAVGKRFSNFNDSRDEYSQSSTLVKVVISTSYKGSLKNFVADIAILVTRVAFYLHDGVMPVCVNFGTEKLEQDLLMDERNMGHVPGFGRTETGNVSETLKEIAVPYIKQEKCAEYLPEDFIEYYSYDKFCAGHLNRSMAVCSGDSGGGLVMQNPQDKRFYLVGIVSVSPLDTIGPLDCNIQQYALYTKIHEYKDFIRDECGEYFQISIRARHRQLAQSVAVKECLNYVKTSPSINSSNSTERRVIPGEFPFLAIIGTERKNRIWWYCSGTLVSERFVLTAAGCASNKTASSLIVRLGIYNYNDLLSEADKNLKHFSVKKIYNYPEYRPPQMYNDIALLKLDRKVQFSDSIRPACLNMERNLLPGGINVKSGTWANRRNILVACHLKTHKVEECERYFRRISGDALTEGVVDMVQFCATPTVYRNYKPQPNFCELFRGDSLAVVKNDTITGKAYFSIVGVVSYSKECQKVNNLVLFTKVAAFIPWIESVVWHPEGES